MGRQASLLGKAIVIAGVSISLCAAYVGATGFARTKAEPDAQQSAPRLKWFFDKDPRLSGIAVGAAQGVIQLLVVKSVEYIYGRSGSLADIYLTVKVEASESCEVKRDEDLFLSLRLPENFLRRPLDQGDFRIYDTQSSESIKVGHRYYAILECGDQQQLSYVIE